MRKKTRTYTITGRLVRMSHRKCRETKQQLSWLPDLALLSCCLVPLHFLCDSPVHALAILSTASCSIYNHSIIKYYKGIRSLSAVGVRRCGKRRHRRRLSWRQRARINLDFWPTLEFCRGEGGTEKTSWALRNWVAPHNDDDAECYVIR